MNLGFADEAAGFGSKWALEGSPRVTHRLMQDLQELFLADTSAEEILQRPRGARGKIYLGVIGEIGTGKGVFADYMKARHSALHERYSTRVRALVNRWGIIESRANLQKIAMDLRGHFGDDILTKPILESVLESPASCAVVEGIRLSGDIRDLRRLPGFKLVYVTAPVDICYARIASRGENQGDTTKTFEEFTRERGAATEVEIAELGMTADFRIDNVGTLGEYHEKIWQILFQIDPARYQRRIS